MRTYVDGAAIGRCAQVVDVVHLLERAVRSQPGIPGGENRARCWVEGSQSRDSGTANIVVATAGPQDVVGVELHIAYTSVGCANPCWVKGAGGRIEFDQVRSGLTICTCEVSARPHRCSIGFDGVNSSVDARVEGGVDRTRTGVELGDTNTEGAVDLCEAASDVQVGAIRGECDRVNDFIAARDDRRKGRINMTRGDVDCS